jgi:hypothetical protein
MPAIYQLQAREAMNEHSYHVDKSTSSRRRRIIRFLVVLGAVVLVVGGLSLRSALKPNTVIHDASATTTHISLLPTQSFHLQTFQINLPQDWKQITPPTTQAAYSWRGATKDTAARSLDVYVDQIPANFAVNRMLPLTANGSGVQATGGVSNNCSTFTLASTTDPRTGIAPSKWDGIDFLCDMANFVRDVVGTSSAEGVNTLSVAGPSGVHRYFFVYTDHSGEPEYDTLTAAIQSFQAL